MPRLQGHRVHESIGACAGRHRRDAARAPDAEQLLVPLTRAVASFRDMVKEMVAFDLMKVDASTAAMTSRTDYNLRGKLVWVAGHRGMAGAQSSAGSRARGASS